MPILLPLSSSSGSRSHIGAVISRTPIGLLYEASSSSIASSRVSTTIRALRTMVATGSRLATYLTSSSGSRTSS